ncbi:hypothetical protein A2116_01410 [Candidatus Jorgensenbacteria bacterium GWA1_49_17]|uniref:Uncharacterized protein n=1 Tax=Candidatus Jorgensenbacteria bacterium GWA1_49_17 TaxID=1798467 RepID=A0A1F6BTL1_9BACT|nr:MAG: hypothetical protein A2116_01410 [Candidatus Jorgensenbacteria bacterium GWA1_49_17]
MTIDRWETISKRDQLGHIAAEIFRARNAKDQSVFRAILERALELVDLTLQDRKRRGDSLTLFYLRDKIAEAYESGKIEEADKIYAVI